MEAGCHQNLSRCEVVMISNQLNFGAANSGAMSSAKVAECLRRGIFERYFRTEVFLVPRRLNRPNLYGDLHQEVHSVIAMRIKLIVIIETTALSN